jgi:transposase-like protein
MQYPSDVIALVVFWRLRYGLRPRDLADMFLIGGFGVDKSVHRYSGIRDNHYRELAGDVGSAILGRRDSNNTPRQTTFALK